MIFIYFLSALIGLAVYATTSRLRKPVRIAIALIIFIALSVSATIWIVVIGDKAPPDATTISPADL